MILPPVTSLCGHSASQEANCAAEENFEKSAPTSAIIACAVKAWMPGTAVKSVPSTR